MGSVAMEKKFAQSHKDLEAYQMAFEAAMQIFEIRRVFPPEERYALTGQMRRSSRSVCANITEAWRKRRYEADFVHRLSHAETEAAETQTWLDFALRRGYISSTTHHHLCQTYDHIIGKIVTLINNPTPWLLPPQRKP
jgi:four helix bundle protein